MLEVSEKEEGVVALPFKTPLLVGAGTKKQTQYLPAH